jgi:hypothetical protein
VVLVLAAGLGYGLHHRNPGYADTATVAFTAPQSFGPFAGSQALLVIDELTANRIMSTKGQQEDRDAGGTADYDAALVNLHNQDYPDYSVPYVNVTTTSPSPVAAQDTLSAVLRVLADDLSALQAGQGVKPGNRIGLRVIAAPTGPLVQGGSPKRTLAGLGALTIIIVFSVAGFLDRHPIHLRKLLHRRAFREATLRRPTVRVSSGTD